MIVGAPQETDSGLWSAAIHPGHADLLLGALDQAWPFVLIETWDGVSDWHEAIVSIGADDEPRRRVVRQHSVDLLVDPSEAVGIGQLLRRQGLSGGGFGCYQFARRPKATFRLPESGRPRADSMRGQGVELSIELPHDGEVAVVASPIEDNLTAYLERLG